MFTLFGSLATVAAAAVLLTPGGVFWFAAGLVSALALGPGIPTGTLYLLPYSLETATKSTSLCQTLLHTLPAALCWGLGTSVGEIPPFFMGRTKPVGADKVASLIQTKGRGFIFLMACYPNVLFDYVGLACGSLKVPFLFFFVPTLLGKTFVKAPLQNLLYCSVGFYGRDVVAKHVPEWLLRNTSNTTMSTTMNAVCVVVTVCSCCMYLRLIYHKKDHSNCDHHPTLPVVPSLVLHAP